MPDAPAPTRPERHYRAYLFSGFVLAALVVFGILFFFARTVPYFSFDLPVARAVQAIPSSPFATLMYWVSWLGFAPQSYLWCAAIIILLFALRLRWEAVMALFAAVGVTVVGQVVKVIVHRARPTPDLVRVFSEITEYSFPSGHVLFFTAFLGFVVFLLYTLAPRSWWRTAGMSIAGALIVLVGVSRVYLGEHFPSDVLGAYLLGSLWLMLTIYVYRWGTQRHMLTKPVHV